MDGLDEDGEQEQAAESIRGDGDAGKYKGMDESAIESGNARNGRWASQS